MNAILLTTLLFFTLAFCSEEECARTYLQYLNDRLQKTKSAREQAKWHFLAHVSDKSMEKLGNLETEIYEKDKIERKKLCRFNWDSFRDPTIKRQYEVFKNIKHHALPSEKARQLVDIQNLMLKTYAEAKIISYHNMSETLSFLELSTIFSKIQNPAELKHIWVEWRSVVGSDLRSQYPIQFALLNESARLNGYPDFSSSIATNYEFPSYWNFLNETWGKIRPLYLQLHAYVRYKLREKYEAYINKEGPMPMHLTGHIYGSSWDWLSGTTQPFYDRPRLFPNSLRNFTKTRRQLYQLADDFFASMNFSRAPPEFWKYSLFEKPDNTEVFCHSYVFKFMERGKFRVIDCESEEDLTSLPTALEAMGTIQKYLQAENQPFIFQKGILETMTDALGELFSLSINTYYYINEVLDLNFPQTEEDVFNSLYSKGLKFIPQFPLALAGTFWKIHASRGTITPQNYNCGWWKLVHEYQGLEPPKDRTEEDFDVGVLNKFILNRPLIDKFWGKVLAYQLHKALCEKFGLYEKGNPDKPLHSCSLYGQVEAGNLITEGLKYGRSKRWSYVLDVITGESKLNADAFLEYFEPLMKWLLEVNKRNQAPVGWGAARRVCVTEEGDKLPEF